MQSRFTATGVTADDKEVLLAYELKEEEFKVTLHIVPKKSLKGELLEQLLKNWVEGGEFEFPKGTKEVNPKLQGEESILPSDIRSEESWKIRIKQNEWAYTLLTAKLWESYLLELDELKKKAATLTQYDRSLFDDAKSFWERVLEHRKERDISQESLDKIKDDVNSVFEKLKTFRKTETAEFEANSAKLREEIIAKLEDLRKRVNEKSNFKLLLEEHKNIQNESRKNRYNKADDVLVRKNLDSCFQFINEQRHHFFHDLTANRVKGLTEVIDKMEASLVRDRKDLDYMQRKAESNKISSLEMQLIKVKTNMMNETIASKEEKLKDIRATLEQVLKQSGQAKKKEAKETVKEEKEETKTEPVLAEVAEPTDVPNPSPGE
jgi:ElaB/YqjD/DUF883 family membrane-anchored ribosome-binding protein